MEGFSEGSRASLSSSWKRSYSRLASAAWWAVRFSLAAVLFGAPGTVVGPYEKTSCLTASACRPRGVPSPSGGSPGVGVWAWVRSKSLRRVSMSGRSSRVAQEDLAACFPWWNVGEPGGGCVGYVGIRRFVDHVGGGIMEGVTVALKQRNVGWNPGGDWSLHLGWPVESASRSSLEARKGGSKSRIPSR